MAQAQAPEGFQQEDLLDEHAPAPHLGGVALGQVDIAHGLVILKQQHPPQQGLGVVGGGQKGPVQNGLVHRVVHRVGLIKGLDHGHDQLPVRQGDVTESQHN